VPHPRLTALIQETGAVVMGKRTFAMAEDPAWFVGNYEFQVPIFVLTHTLADELHVDVAPVLLGAGLRLFDPSDLRVAVGGRVARKLPAGSGWSAGRSSRRRRLKLPSGRRPASSRWCRCRPAGPGGDDLLHSASRTNRYVSDWWKRNKPPGS